FLRRGKPPPPRRCPMRRIAFVMVLTAALAGSSRADVFTFTNSGEFFAKLNQLGLGTGFTETYQGSPPNTPVTPLGTTIPQGGPFNGLTYNFSAPPIWANQSPAIGRIDGNVFDANGNNLYKSYNGFGIPNAPNPAFTIQTLAALRANPFFASLGETPNSSVFYPGEFITVKPSQQNQKLFAAGAFFNAAPAAAGDFF